MLIDAGTLPEVLLKAIFVLFVLLYRPKNYIGITQVEEIVEQHCQNPPIEEDLENIIADKGPGCLHSRYSDKIKVRTGG